jgi:ABC-type nitrate/sulfonate/bicarbonate transport system substrate-binding protein
MNHIGKIKGAVLSICLVGMISLSGTSTVAASTQKSQVVQAKENKTTVYSRTSKVTKTAIIETSLKTETKTVVRTEKNSAKSKSTQSKGTKVLKGASDTKISAKTSVITTKTLTNTTVATVVVTKRVQTFPKAPKGKLKFSFATASDGMSGVPLREAIERMNFKYGYQGKVDFISNSDLVIAGGASGQFDMGNSSTSAAMKVILNGAPMRFIGENIKNTWTLVGKNSVKSCADMNGVRLGLHSAGGSSTALYRAWAAKNCAANIKPKEQYINGSPNRLIALAADQIDVAMMEVEDTLFLPAGYSVIANFSKTLPGVKTGLVWMNSDFLAKNPKVAANLMYELTWLAQEMNHNAASMKRIAIKWTTGYTDYDKIVVAYQDALLFPEDAEGFFKELDSSAVFFKITPLRAVDMAVLAPLKQAMVRLNF